MEQNRHRNRIVTSIIAMLLCLCVMTGATFALFTDGSKISVNVVSATVDVDATLDKNTLKVFSLSEEQTVTNAQGEHTFANNGTASFDAEGNLVLDRITPGDKATFTINVKNNSNVLVKYRLIWAVEGELKDQLIAKANSATIIANTSQWILWDTTQENEMTIDVAIELPVDVTDEHQGKTAVISFTIEAVQANATQVADEWDGTVDTSWYTSDATTFTLNSAEAFAGFASIVGTTDQFEGKTVNLDIDLDLNGMAFAPIGTTGERDDRNRLITQSFKGTFDGQGHSIENFTQSGWDYGYEWGQYGSVGLFSSLESATVKNVTVSGATIEIEGGDVGGITGSAEGNCVFENVTVENTNLGTYNNGIGGIIGWSGAGEYTFKNVKISDDVVLGGLWGSFDSSIGGVIGQGEVGATYNFEDVDIACRLDAYNDVTASYQYYLYRMTGMIIGRLEATTTIDGRNYPDMSQYNINCNNVTVTYGDWMNYHYCYGFNGSRYTRVEAGFAYGGLDIQAEDHNTTCTDHMLCLPFDGLFGGDQYGVSPIREYTGVTVIYPASYTPENN